MAGTRRRSMEYLIGQAREFVDLFDKGRARSPKEEERFQHHAQQAERRGARGQELFSAAVHAVRKGKRR